MAKKQPAAKIRSTPKARAASQPKLRQLLRIKNRPAFEREVRKRVKERHPLLAGNRRLGAASDWVADYVSRNPNATAAEVRTAIRGAIGDGTILAALGELIMKIAPLLIQVIKLFMGL